MRRIFDTCLLLSHTNYVLCEGLKIYNAICSLVLGREFLIRCPILVCNTSIVLIWSVRGDIVFGYLQYVQCYAIWPRVKCLRGRETLPTNSAVSVQIEFQACVVGIVRRRSGLTSEITLITHIRCFDIRHSKPKLVLCSKQTMRLAETDYMICFRQSHGLFTTEYKFWFINDMQSADLPTLSFDPTFMKVAQCAETNEKTIFRFLFLELL